MIPITFRPLQSWPAEFDASERPSQFRTSHNATLKLLRSELERLDAEQVMLEVALREDQIRLDGLPRADAYPRHPGVILSFNSKHGPLRYGTRAFNRWTDNLRAIALGLEHLRAVDRYGISKRGEQYTGWKALPAGGDQRRAQRGRVRDAERATHPDSGGSAEDFAAVQAAKELAA